MLDVRREIDLPVTPRSVMPLRNFAQRCLGEAEVPETTRREVLAAIDDVVVALLLRSQQEERKGHVCLEIDVNDTRVRVVVRDDSEGIELEQGATEFSLQHFSRPRREVGLSLLRRVMDEVKYSYTRGFENCLEMIKFV